jgi:hypothetical protein
MKYIAYNFVAVCLLVLAALLAYWNKDGWGWCIVAAIICAVFPTGDSKKKDEKRENISSNKS